MPTDKPSYLGHRERIRAKFAASGLAPLADHEVLELLLTYAIARRDTKPLAWALIKQFGSLGGSIGCRPRRFGGCERGGQGHGLFLKTGAGPVYAVFFRGTAPERNYPFPGAGGKVLQSLFGRAERGMFGADLFIRAQYGYPHGNGSPGADRPRKYQPAQNCGMCFSR